MIMMFQFPGGPLLKYWMPRTTRPARTADPAVMRMIAPTLNPASSYDPIVLAPGGVVVVFEQAHQSTSTVVELTIF